MLKNLFLKYKSRLNTNPLLTKVLTGISVFSISDYSIQRYENIKPKHSHFELNKIRNIKWSLFGVFTGSLLHLHFLILKRVRYTGYKLKIFYVFYNIFFQIPLFSLSSTIYNNFIWQENPKVQDSVIKFKNDTKRYYVYLPVMNLVIFS